MVIIKNYYYLYIEDLLQIDFINSKYNKKINIIYRSKKKEKIYNILKLRQKCKAKKFKFFIANNERLAKICKADGLYISASNKKRYYNNLAKIGSAHNIKEINEKISQNCKTVICSRLFSTKCKKGFLGVPKFNLLTINTKVSLIPLGGINFQNLLKLNIVKCEGFACLSVLKKKPAISSRLF